MFRSGCLLWLLTLALQVSGGHGKSHTGSVAGTDSLRVLDLCRQMEHYSRVMNNARLADSVGSLAVETAASTFRPGLLLLAYNTYLENADLREYKDKAMKYALAAGQLSATDTDPAWDWRCYLNLSRTYLSDYDYDNALVAAYKSLTLAEDLNDGPKKVDSYLMVGRSLEGLGQKTEAFRNYLLASKTAKRLNEKPLMLRCYGQLSDFFLSTGMFQKAANYKLIEQELILDRQPVDSLALMWIDYDLQVINLNSNNPVINDRKITKILDFANRNNREKLAGYTRAVYRSILTRMNRMDLLERWYTKEHPDDFNRLYNDSPSFYYRLKAYFAENQGQNDSAMIYFSMAEKQITDNSNKVFRSNFYFRYGQFLIRTGQHNKAVKAFKQGFQLAKEANYPEFMLKASQELEKLFALEQKYKEAFYFSVLTRNLDDSISQMADKDKLIMLEINHEAEQQKLAEEQERQETLRRHNLQYTAIVITMITIFIILILLGSFRVPAWLIRALGFLSFIFLFEFIILLADQKIHHLTHGEPWKILVIKIALIAFLLPFHHWIEHKVVQQLVRYRLINLDGFSFRNLFGKKKEV